MPQHRGPGSPGSGSLLRVDRPPYRGGGLRRQSEASGGSVVARPSRRRVCASASRPSSPMAGARRMDTFRLFNCQRCHEQVRLCRSCFRGQQFCAPCAPLARTESCRAYARAHRQTLAGKLGNARRQAEHRARRRRAPALEVVTHQGSEIAPPGGEPAPSSPVAVASTPAEPEAPPPEEDSHAFLEDAANGAVRPARCSFCGRPLPAFTCRRGTAPPRRRRARRRGARPRIRPRP